MLTIFLRHAAAGVGEAEVIVDIESSAYQRFYSFDANPTLKLKQDHRVCKSN